MLGGIPATQAPVCKLLASASPCVEAASMPINCELMVSRPFFSGNAYVAPASDPPGMAGPEVQDSAEVAKGRSVLFF